MTTAMPPYRWSLPRPSRVFALWATVVIHVLVLGAMLTSKPPEMRLIASKPQVIDIPLIERNSQPPPPRPPEPEVQPTPTPPPVVPVQRVQVAPPTPVTTDQSYDGPVEPPVVATISLDDNLPMSERPPMEIYSPPRTDFRQGIDFQCRSTPRYPIRELRAGREGDVLLRVRLSANGQKAAVDVARSSGYAFERAAMKWIEGCQFNAPSMDNGSVERVGEVPVRFVLIR